MQSHDGKTESSWWAGVDVPKFGPLERDETCDVCIVGAGIAGLSVAYHLTKAGKSVIVIDDSGIGDGQTGRTSAHLASEWDDRYFEAAQSLGVEKTKLIYDSHAKAIDSIEAISKAEGFDCEFERVDGWLFLAPNDKPSLIDDELKAAHEAGFVSVEKRDRLPVSTIASGPALRFPNQAQFHPMKYLVGLANAITARGGRIISGERVIDVQGTDPKKKTPAVATTFKGRTVTAREAIAVCTNTPAPINDWVGIYTKQAAYRTFVVAFRVEKGSIPKGLYWDTLDPYHYVRIQELEDHDRLLVGGEDHKTGQREEASDDPFAELGRWSRSHFPKVGAIQFQWSGQVQEPDDGVAFIGRAPHGKENVYVCTGDSGMGLTHGAIAGMLISDQILGRLNPWESLYDPSRKPTGNISDFIKENANVTRKYGQHFTGGDVSDAAEIAVGQGAIMRVGASKLAVHRDETGTLHACSAVCTHLGCVVQWNTLEKTWDCHCHGARYDRGGHVIMGPAINDLAVAVPPPDSGSK